MRLTEIKGLDIGDAVFWVDPDADGSPQPYFVAEILTESGYLEDLEDVLVIRDTDGCATEIFASELH